MGSNPCAGLFREAEGDRMTYPYFQICSYGNRKDLFVWEEHFRNLEIPYAVTCKPVGDNHTFHYALWREGKEYRNFENGKDVGNEHPIDGQVVVTFGGFRKYLEDGK